jgi:hypothetical protein
VATVNYKAIAKGQAPDIWLEPGDIVYVPFSPFRAIGELADRVLHQFVGAIALNEGVRAVDRNGSLASPILGLGGSGLGGIGPIR